VRNWWQKIFKPRSAKDRLRNSSNDNDIRKQYLQHPEIEILKSTKFHIETVMKTPQVMGSITTGVI
jgi:hypothetical protein